MTTMSQWNEFLQQLNTAIEHGQFHIRGATWKGIDLEIDCSIAIIGEAQPSHWLLTCKGLMAYEIFGEYPSGSLDVVYTKGDFYIGEDHPLLWPFNTPRMQLYVKYSAEVQHLPETLAGALYHAHNEQVGDWIEFDRFLNTSTFNLLELLSKPYGLIAEGPLPLLEVYRDTLSKYGLKASLLEAGPPFHQRMVYDDDPNMLRVVTLNEVGKVSLLELGDAYFIAGEFTVARKDA